MSLQPSPSPAPTELVAIVLERNGKDEMRFVPTCAGCGELILDPTTANVAVVIGTGSGKLTKTDTRHLGARVSPYRRTRLRILLGV